MTQAKQETKTWWKSLTLWGATLVGVAGILLPMIGQPDVGQAIEESKLDIASLLEKVGEVIGLAIIIYGRIRARKVLTVTEP